MREITYRNRYPKGLHPFHNTEVIDTVERNQELKSFSRQLRKSTTKEESLLWYNFLSKYPLRFRRQYVIGNYIVDFYCHKAKLVIELDGSQHYDAEEVRKDQIRTEYLKTQGVRVLRFTNLDIQRNFRIVCEQIHKACGEPEINF